MNQRGWIKICGMTTADAVAAAVESGVDAIGFVFSPSVRRVSAAHASELARAARDRVSCVAVTRHPTQSEIDEIVSVFRPDVLQTDIEDLDQLRLPSTLPRLPVLRGGAATAICGTLPARLLFEGPHSGTGQTSDWQQAATLARQTRVLLAGGLHAGNVAEAIASVRPAGVDTSTGVESSPGIKSPARMAEFVRAARAAFARLEQP
jgi:phosphoribosylanthranilate isomerase